MFLCHVIVLVRALLVHLVVITTKPCFFALLKVFLRLELHLENLSREGIGHY